MNPIQKIIEYVKSDEIVEDAEREEICSAATLYYTNIKGKISEKDAEISALHERVSALQTIVYAHAFKALLNGETGHTYLRCCACNGDNESKIRHNLNPDEVNHEHNCSVAAVLQEAQ